MRHAFPLAVLFLSCAAAGCAASGPERLADATPHVTSPAPQRGAELYGRYCTGCHAGAVHTQVARTGAPWLMHIQARVGMGTTAGLPDTVTREDTRLIVDYLDSAPAPRQDD